MRRVAIAPVVGILLAALTSTIGASGVNGAYTCSSSSSCLSANQSAPAGATGAAIKGAATNSYGVRGVSTNSTAILGQSASGSPLYPGVEGESTATSSNVTDLAGGFGLSALSGGHVPQLGALGIGLAVGITGENTSSSSAMSAGVVGTDYTGEAAGVVGQSQATSGTVNGNGGVGVAGMLETYQDGVAGIGVYGQGSGSSKMLSPGSYGGYFASNGTTTSSNASGNNVGLGVEGSKIAEVLYNTAYGTQVEIGNSASLLSGSGNSGSFVLQNNGNFTTSGTVTGSSIQTSGDAMYRQSGASGSALTAYGMRAAAPELEDVGGAELVNGRAVVHIDAKLADVMDRQSVYRVFLTPDGDCKGLFVAQKTPTSFVVGELQGGRSTMSFDYRIVATPYGHTRERLAVAPPIERASTPRTILQDSGKRMRLPSFITPPDRALRASLGAQRYANLMAAKRKELARP